MNSRAVAVFVLLLTFFTGTNAVFLQNAQAGENPSQGLEQTLTWNDCVQEAIVNHPDLASARQKVRQSKASQWITASALLPQVSGVAQGGAAKRPSASSRVGSYSYGLTGRQLLFDGFKTYFDVEQAAKNVDVNRFNYDVTSSNVRYRLRTAFVLLLKAQDLLVMVQDIKARRKQNEEMIQLRYDAGREHRGSLLTAQADLAQAQFDIEQAKRSIDLAQRQLTKELGRSRLTSVKAVGDFSTADQVTARPDFETLSVSTPFLQALVLQKEAARWGVKSAIASFFPQVYASTAAGVTDSHWPPKGDEWSAGVSFSIPLFEGGSIVAQADKAQSQLRQAEADEKSGRDGVVFTLENAWTQFQDDLGRELVQQKFLEAARERAKIAQAQYSAGLVTFNDWIIIENNLVSAQKLFLNAQANTLLSEANWLQAKGETLDAD